MPKPILYAISTVCLIALFYSEAMRADLRNKYREGCKEPVREWIRKAQEYSSIAKSYERSAYYCLSEIEYYTKGIRVKKTKNVQQKGNKRLSGHN